VSSAGKRGMIHGFLTLPWDRGWNPLGLQILPISCYTLGSGCDLGFRSRVNFFLKFTHRHRMTEIEPTNTGKEVVR